MSLPASSLEQQLAHLHALAQSALRAWALHGAELTLIKYRENAVFRVQTTTGERFALRIHRAGYHSVQALRSELLWVDALAQGGMDVPRVIPSPNGDLLVGVSVDGDEREADLFAWVDGEQLGNVETMHEAAPDFIRSAYTTIGEIAARLHNHASQWAPPESFERHAWDLEGLVGESPFWGRFWELSTLTDAQRALILQVRDEIRADLSRYDRENMRYSMIHADFSPENFLVDGSSVRLIDFDDAGFGWHMFEIATALFFIQETPFYDMAKAALLNGYRQHRPLSQQDIDILPLFLAARGFTYLGWVQSRSETETARELTPKMIEMACASAERYLKGHEK